MFLIHHRAGPQARHMIAQGLSRLRRDRPGRYGILQVAFAIHSSSSPDLVMPAA